MTKQTKKQICENSATIAYYSGSGGLEAKHIEYGINDYIYLVADMVRSALVPPFEDPLRSKNLLRACSDEDACFPNLSDLEWFLRLARPGGPFPF